jgi:lipoate-protein ligase A
LRNYFTPVKIILFSNVTFAFIISRKSGIGKFFPQANLVIMLIVLRQTTDPYLNLSAEEYFVKNATEDMCMLWINEKSVIIGKHQNAYAEINYPYLCTHHIPVIRRISGGGAVYHDSGNINFTFIQKTGKSNPVDFNRFTSVIVNFMQSIGIEAYANKRNSLFIGDRKFSGHAEHIFHEKVLHHGTILFNTDLDVLQQSLNPAKEYPGKAMASVRNDVVNIASLLSENINIQHFTDLFASWLFDFFSPGCKLYSLSNEELENIATIAESKYKTWEWNFGYSPAYSFEADIMILNDSFPISMKVENGKFIQVDLPVDPKITPVALILKSLIGVLHKEEEIDKFVEKNLQGLELAGINTAKLRDAFFK